MERLTFTLEIGALGAERLRALEFDLVETVSQCFVLRIRAVSEDGDLTDADLIGKPAGFTFATEAYPVAVYGTVTEFHQYPDTSGNHGHESVIYDLLIEPTVKKLDYTVQNRIFQNLSVPDILKKVLKEAGDDHFRLELSATYPVREYTVQYNESDLNFAQRLMEDEGIWYYFDHASETDVMVLVDKQNPAPLADMPSVTFRGDTGLTGGEAEIVNRMRRGHRMHTGKTLIKDYNDRTPEVKIQGNAEGSQAGQGQHQYFPPHAKDTGSAQTMAKIRAEMLACDKVKLDGEGNVRAFRAGYRFELAEAPSEVFNGKFFLIRVEHHGDQRQGFESADENHSNYTNRFTCLPADTVYRPQLNSPKPRVHGVLTAKVDGPQGNYAYLDEEGRYHAKLPFDLTSEGDGGASLPIRLSQPYGGPDYGMHFPIHNGNDMVVAFIDGDVDRPIALGTTPNPSNGSPVTSRNKTESVIKTASGHILRMDDNQDKTIVDLTTAGKHLLAMDDAAASQSVKIKTAKGHLLTLDDAGKNVTILSTGGHTIKIDDAGKSITIETKGGHSMVMDDSGKSITLKDGQGVNTVTLDGGGKALSLVSTGDIKIEATKNIVMKAGESITIDATKELGMHADGAVSLTADKTMVQEAKKDYTLKAKKVGVTSESDIIMAGKKMDVKVDNDFKVAAGKVNIKADGDVILKGSKVAQN